MKRTVQSTNSSTPYPSIDWSSYFLDCRSQGSCGSCWAFSFSGTLEAHIAIYGLGPKAYLSPQYLINCDTVDGGCNGGAFPNTFGWIQSNGHILDTLLPYSGNQTTCDNTLSNQTSASMPNFYFCSSLSLQQPCSEDLLYSFLQKGPVNVGIDASSDDFMNYASGTFTNSNCAQSNHAVILCGFGVDASGNQYWLIRNSWGTDWGQNGYIQVLRNDTNNNSCFIGQEAFIPNLSNSTVVASAGVSQNIAPVASSFKKRLF